MVIMMLVVMEHVGETVRAGVDGSGGGGGGGGIIAIGIAIFKWKCTPYSLFLRTFSHVGLEIANWNSFLVVISRFDVSLKNSLFYF